MEKKVTITRQELIEVSAQAAANVVDKIAEHGDHLAAALSMALSGAVLASEMADILFGSEEA